MWKHDEEKLDLVLDGLTQELIAYEQKVLNISREDKETLEICMVLTSKPNLHDKNDKIDNDHICDKTHEKIKICKK